MKKPKIFLLLLLNYSFLIGFIIGLRKLHGMEINLTYYIIISSVIIVLLAILSFIEPHHLEKILPKDSTATLILILTLRFMPLTKRKILNIKHAQEMRGGNFGKIGQFKNYSCLLIPAIVNIIKWADNISEGIRMRGGE